MIPLFKVNMSEEARKIVGDTLESGFIGEGPRVLELELALKNRLHNLLTLTLNSATSGLHLALHLIKKPYSIDCGHAPPIASWPGIQFGDEVLTSPLTCTASNWPILANGMNIKWVDVDPDTCNMDLEDLSRKITNRTKVIVLVHWGGNPIDLNKVKEIQDEARKLHGWAPVIIEDCAHAMGSVYKGKPLGNHGNIAVYSFQAIKHFTTGDGGCIVLPYAELYKRAKLMRWYGIDRDTNSKDFRCEDNISEWGFKMHMNDISASIGLANLPYIDPTVAKHNKNSASIRYNLHNEYLYASYDPMRKDVFSAEWVCTLAVKDPLHHDSIMRYLRNAKIVASRVHERNDIHSCVSNYRSMLPGVDQACSTMFCVPCGWWLTDDNLAYIIETLNKWNP